MLEALWSVEFGSNLGSFGAGVAVFETSRVLGGDSAYMYIGSFSVKDGLVNADIRVTKYNHHSGMQSIFGPISAFNLKVSGKADPKEMLLTGTLVEQPAMSITIKAKRQAELP